MTAPIVTPETTVAELAEILRARGVTKLHVRISQMPDESSSQYDASGRGCAGGVLVAATDYGAATLDRSLARVLGAMPAEPDEGAR